MDTPEKTKISTPLSKFEESPVFSYINSLSPIKPVKSVHATQAFHSLSFSSIPSIFSSPHATTHKESRFSKSIKVPDAVVRSELSSENGKKGNKGIGKYVAELCENSTELQEDLDSGAAAGEDFKFAMELPRTLKNDCGSPDGNMRTCSTQVDGASETVDITDMSLSIIPLVKEASEKNLPEVEAHLQGINLIEQKNESAQCDWESMISDSDLLIFNSPVHSEAFKGLIQKSLDTDAKFCVSHDDLIKMQDFDIMDMEDPSTQPNESIDPKEIINQTHQQLVACYGSETSIPTDQNEAGTSTAVTCKAISNIRRGMRRRCLDFEIVTTRNNSGCSALVESEEETASKGKQLVPVKPVNDSSKCIIRGIGLHLNSLAKTSKENQEAPASSVKNLICSTSSFHSPTTVQDLDEQLAMVSAETAGVPSIDDVLIAEDVTQASSYPVNEELDQGSPRKKRNKVDTEDGSCKRCNCKKSKCLKLYCECFAAGVYCIEPCSCQDCYNKPIHEDTVLATRKQIETRNPLAFAPKVIRSSEPIAETGDEFSKTPASARHKRGCNCKKSSCLKKYCECYQGGVGCSVSCRCEGCKNTFGRKDGSALPDTEAVPEAVPEDETEAVKSGADKVSQSTDNENNEEQNSAVPSTPLGLCRPLVQLPFSSKGKPPRSFLGIGLSSRLYPGKLNILQGQTKFVKPLQTIPSDDMPDVLHTKCSPSNGVKTSPNGKRVSPPQINAESSPARMSRKLILQSIPSFPSLTHQQ